MGEQIRPPYDNEFSRYFLEDEVAVDLSNVTRVTIELDQVYDSAELGGVGAGEEIDCSEGSSGKIIFRLGGQSVSSGRYDAEVVTYDTTHTNGLVWPTFTVEVP